MQGDSGFFLTWSTAEAWDWLITVPVMGFIMLVALAIVGIFFGSGVLSIIWYSITR